MMKIEKGLTIKTISFIVLASFLFSNPAYPNNLRVPLASNANADQEEGKRLQHALALILKEGIHSYRPGSSFKGWTEAKKAVQKRFRTDRERKEALQLVRRLARRLANNRIAPEVTLKDAIPAVVELAENIDELRDVSDYLAERYLENHQIFIRVISMASRPSEDIARLRETCDYIVPRFAEVVREAPEIELRSPDFSTAIGFYRRYGGFEVEYEYTYVSKGLRPHQEGGFGIRISPPTSARGEDRETLASNGEVGPPIDITGSVSSAARQSSVLNQSL